MTYYLHYIKEREKDARSIIVRYIHRSQLRYPYWIPPLNIRIINIHLLMITLTNIIDINLAEILITILLENLLKASLKRVSENIIRNTCIIRIYISLTYV